MNGAFAALMLVAGGLFAGGAATFAWSRVPVWRRLPIAEFARDFEATIRWTDKVQPALLVLAALAGAAFSIGADASARLLGALGSAGLLTVLIASLAILVPLQRRIVADARTGAEDVRIDAMRRRWFAGNQGRSILAVASFGLLVAAALA